MNIGYNDLEDRVSNIVSGDDTHNVAKYVLEQIADTIAVTVGPYGHSVIIEDPTVGHYTTKDGFTVMNNMSFPGSISGVIHNLIKKVSENLVTKVGDGSTSSVLIANTLYTELSNMIKDDNIRPKYVMEVLEEITTHSNKYIKEISTQISEDLHELKDIATISLNNDTKMGELISNAYKELGTTDGFINVKLGKGEHTTFECVKGFQIDRGFMDRILINVPDTEECVLNNPKVLMFDAGLHDSKFIEILQTIARGFYTNGENLIVLLPGAGKNIRTWLAAFYRQNKSLNLPVRINFVELPNGTEEAYKAYEDLAIKTGSRIVQTMDSEEDNIDWQILNEYYGSVDSVVSTESNTTFIGSNGDPDMIQTRLAEIKREVETATHGEDVIMSSKTYKLKKRLAVMTDKLATINVGGITDQAKIADKALIDDSVAACKSAIHHGYVKGCNVALTASIIHYIYNECVTISESDRVKRRIANAVLSSSIEGYKRVLMNAKIKPNNSLFDMVSHITGTENNITEVTDSEVKEALNSAVLDVDINIVKESNTVNVINSAETDIEIMKAISSIVGLLITSKGAITKIHKSSYMG